MITWVVLLSHLLLELLLILMLPVLVSLSCILQQLLLDCFDEPSHRFADQVKIASDWCLLCGRTCCNCDQVGCYYPGRDRANSQQETAKKKVTGRSRTLTWKLTCRSQRESVTPFREVSSMIDGHKTAALTLVPLILLLYLAKILEFGVPSGNNNNVVSVCDYDCNSSNQPVESESTTFRLLVLYERPEGPILPGSNSRPGFIVQRKFQKFHYPQIKFIFYDGKAPTLSFWSIDRLIWRQFIILCYEFFSVAYANVIPMLSHSEEALRRHNKAVGPTIQVQLQGGPNHGYCAMLAIGLEEIQEVFVYTRTLKNAHCLEFVP